MKLPNFFRLLLAIAIIVIAGMSVHLLNYKDWTKTIIGALILLGCALSLFLIILSTLKKINKNE